jgi:hypothetical protein
MPQEITVNNYRILAALVFCTLAGTAHAAA